MADIQQVLTQRASTHGDFAQGAITFSQLHFLIQREQETLSAPQYYALTMICTKMTRILNGNPNEPDHWRDIAGYASLALAEIEGK